MLDDAALPAPADIRSVVVFGMGTSATAAEAVAAYGAGRASVPIWVGNGYESPAFVGPHTLAFAVSASGGHGGDHRRRLGRPGHGAPTSSSSPAPARWRSMAAAADLPLFGVPAGPAPRTALGALIGRPCC